MNAIFLMGTTVYGVEWFVYLNETYTNITGMLTYHLKSIFNKNYDN